MERSPTTNVCKRAKFSQVRKTKGLMSDTNCIVSRGRGTQRRIILLVGYPLSTIIEFGYPITLEVNTTLFLLLVLKY